jgi:uncharacterized protein
MRRSQPRLRAQPIAAIAIAIAVLVTGCTWSPIGGRSIQGPAAAAVAREQSEATDDGANENQADGSAPNEQAASEQVATDRAGTDRPATTAIESKPLPPPRGGLEDRLLFFPTKYPDGDWEPRELAYEEVWIPTGDGGKIHGWYMGKASPRAVLLYAHGNGGNLSYNTPLYRWLQNEQNVAVLAFDYRGYGKSEGKPSVEAAIRDARGARQWIADRHSIPLASVVLMGRSLGGAIVAQLAKETPPEKLIIESSFTSLKDMASIHYPALAWLVDRSKLDSRTALSNYEGMLLVSHGDQDKLIPYLLGRDLYDGCPTRDKVFVTIPGGDHNDPQTGDYFEALKRVLKH